MADTQEMGRLLWNELHPTPSQQAAPGDITFFAPPRFSGRVDRVATPNSNTDENASPDMADWCSNVENGDSEIDEAIHDLLPSDSPIVDTRLRLSAYLDTNPPVGELRERLYNLGASETGLLEDYLTPQQWESVKDHLQSWFCVRRSNYKKVKGHGGIRTSYGCHGYRKQAKVPTGTGKRNRVSFFFNIFL